MTSMDEENRNRVFVREVSGAYGTQELLRQIRSWPRVRTIADIPWERGPRTYNKWLVTPKRDPVQSLQIHMESYSPGAKSENHGHQNEAAFYILQGRGYEIHDQRRYDWQAGDLAIVHSSCLHQHFNLSDTEPFTVLIFKTKPLHFMHHLMFQKELEPLPQTPNVGYRPDDSFPKEESQFWNQGTAKATYLKDDMDGLPMTVKRTHNQLNMRKAIKSADMPWEDSPHGRLKHMLNERMCQDMEIPVVSVDAYMQVIEPGSRSGKHRHMSEEFFLVLEGEGYDIHQDVDLDLQMDGYHWKVSEETQRFPWKAGDMVYIPPNTIHQHFAAAGSRVRLLSMSSRVYNFLGYGQFDLVQYENAPEYKG